MLDNPKMRGGRFWEFVSVGDGCWEWRRAKDRRGYGRVTMTIYGKKIQLAHRAAWALWHRRLPPDDFYLCHRCDNPSCVRPSHVFLGTQKMNMGDCAMKGRAVGNLGKLAGERHPMHKLTWDLIREIRLQSHEKDRVLAEQYGVHKSLISLIQRRKIWRELESA